jgi:hypothetical protein
MADVVAAEAQENALKRTWKTAKPHLANARAAAAPHAARAWMVLKVWAPFLAAPNFRQRQVAFDARESRESGVWNIDLPRKCLDCGSDEVTTQHQFTQRLRNFETPLPIVGGILGVFAFFMLIAFFLWGTAFWLALLTLVGGTILMFVKSWDEDVQLTCWSCATHAADAKCPDMVTNEEELVVIVPSAKLAQAGRGQVIAARHAKRGGPAESPPSAATPGAAAPSSPAPTPPARPAIRPGDAPPAAPPRPEVQPYRRGELPPIKLDE